MGAADAEVCFAPAAGGCSWRRADVILPLLPSRPATFLGLDLPYFCSAGG